MTYFFAGFGAGALAFALVMYWSLTAPFRTKERRAAVRDLSALDRLYAQHHEARTRERSFVKRFFDRRGR